MREVRNIVGISCTEINLVKVNTPFQMEMSMMDNFIMTILMDMGK